MEEKMINLKVVTKPEEGRPFLDYRFQAKEEKEISIVKEGNRYIYTTPMEKLKDTDVMNLCAKGVKIFKNAQINTFALSLEKFAVLPLVYTIQGIYLGLYEVENYKTDRQEKCWDIELCGLDGNYSEIVQQVKEAEEIAKGVIFARNLVNAPSNHLTPEKMAETIQNLFEDLPVEVEIFDEKQIKELGMEAFLAVGMTSGYMPRLIVVRYHGNPKTEEVTAFVGKGVTCDTGGYCLKSAASLPGVKGDNGGAAAVTGALYALVKNQVKKNVTVVIPSCENRISRDAFIPGDVIGSMSKKTIEVGNTDAEGRLILADAVTYAIEKEKATRIVDIATLTGAVASMFGGVVAGTLSNDDDFYKEFEQAFENSGEKYWRLPIYDEFKEMLNSDMADISNTSGGCGTITAGLFIQAFTKELPWIHIDIAGTAWTGGPRYEYESKGATGAGVTTLYYLMKENIEK